MSKTHIMTEELVNENERYKNVTGSSYAVSSGTKRVLDTGMLSSAQIIYSDFQASLLDGEEIDSGWLDMANVDKVQFSGFASAAGMTSTIISRADDAQTPLSTPVTYTDGTFYLYNIICRQRYMRFKWTNNTGATVTNVSMEVKSTFGGSDKLSVFPLGIEPSRFSQAALVQAVNKAEQPDGDFVSVRANGEAFSTTTPLGASMLNGAISDSDTTITVDSTASFSGSGCIAIDDEIITYTGTTATTFTGCTRGAEGTTAAAHSDNADVDDMYVSSWVDTDGWAAIELFIKSDVPSTLSGIVIEFTPDAQAVPPIALASQRLSYSAQDVIEGFKDIRIPTILDGLRIRYRNNSTAQSTFNLNAVLRVDSEAFRFGKGGALLTSSFASEVALGLVSNYESNTKFGTVKGTDTVDAAVDIWAFADDASTPRANTKTFPSTASTFYLASSSASDTAVTVTVNYIDADGFAETTTVTLNGQTGVSLGDTALDVNAMFVSGATAAVGRIFCITANNFTAGGVPATPAQTVASIKAGYGQTQQSQFTVPRGKRMVIKDYRIGVSRASGAAGSATITLRIKPFGVASRVIREYFPTTASPIQKDVNLVIEERTQVVWRLDAVSDNETDCSCTWDYELIEK